MKRQPQARWATPVPAAPSSKKVRFFALTTTKSKRDSQSEPYLQQRCGAPSTNLPLQRHITGEGGARQHSRVGHEGLHVLIVRVGQQEGLDALLPRPSVGPTVRAADVLQPPPHPPLLVHEALGSMNNLHMA